MTDIPIVEKLQLLARGIRIPAVPIVLEVATALKECVEALEEAREAIASLPEDGLGLGILPDAHTGGAAVYPIRDELLAKIDATLAAMTKGED